MTAWWEDLRDTLEEELADLLGTYTLRTATGTVTVPAVHRKFGSETPSFYDGFTVKY